MDHITLDALDWHEIAPGVERGELRPSTPGAGSAVLRFAAGSTSGDHRHPGGEELFLLSGRLRIDDTVLSPGDYLYTPPGGVNDAQAYEDSIVFQRQSEPAEFL